MSRISDAFKEKAFIPFITAGDHGIETTTRYIRAMVAAGADLLEIGIPFSDPVAEGPVIQGASNRALQTGVTTDDIFAMVKVLRAGDSDHVPVTIPLLFMTYMNPIFVYGKDKFFRNCQEVGIDGIIIPDTPFEEKQELAKEAKEYGIDIISLIAPTSENRIEMIAKEAEGFIYCVSSLGVTGVRSEIKTDIQGIVETIRKYTDVPVAVGFGISTPEQAANIGKVADGAIVGSAIVKIIDQYGADAESVLSEYVASMKAAVIGKREEDVRMIQVVTETAQEEMTKQTTLELATTQTAQEQIASRCMIPGSLGVWETYFVQMVGAWGAMPDEISPKHIIFGADNGIVKAGHIGYSADITKLMAAVMVKGGSAATRYALYNHIPYDVVDVGINSESPVGRDCKFQKGTDNFLEGPAMTEEAFQFVWSAAETVIDDAVASGINLISFGEMGIGNTTTSAAVLFALTGESVDVTVGPGSGADATTLQKKKAIITDGLELHKQAMRSQGIMNPRAVLRCVGGFDLVALTAAMLRCAHHNVPFVIDGFITATALVAASRVTRDVLSFAMTSHVSREPGMLVALQQCGFEVEDVVLQGKMALGEGTGAVLMVQLLKTTYNAFLTMTSFAEMMQGK